MKNILNKFCIKLKLFLNKTKIFGKLYISKYLRFKKNNILA